jgi:DNA repair protein RadD
MIQLRDYQSLIVEKARTEVANGHRKVLAVLPTGGGKTYILADIARRAVEKGGRVLCLMHRRHLVNQMVDRFKDYGLDAGVIMAGSETDLSRPIQIATIQTYHRRIKLDENGRRPFFVDADVVLIDEAHRSLSRTYQEVLSLYEL